MRQYYSGWSTIFGASPNTVDLFSGPVSLKNATFVNGAPVNMAVPSKGFLYSELVGWTHVSATTFWVLIPGTILALITILVVLVAAARMLVMPWANHSILRCIGHPPPLPATLVTFGEQEVP
ncbi:hypothetical protein B0H13DRAFT_2364744 [Mycena leptocephala]|nr:hypothetical protein B0H13DRAFT_2364744 [Mycena leptocephala]